MIYTEEMTTSEILLRLASMRNELLQAVNDIEKISKNICYKAEQTESNSEKPNSCEKDCFLCKWLGDVDVCGRCRNRNLFAEADTEPKPQTCYTCEYECRDGTDEPCVYCYGGSKYKPKDEPQTNGYQTFNGTSVYVSRLEDEPQMEVCIRPGQDCKACWKNQICEIKDKKTRDRIRNLINDRKSNRKE